MLSFTNNVHVLREKATCLMLDVQHFVCFRVSGCDRMFDDWCSSEWNSNSAILLLVSLTHSQLQDIVKLPLWLMFPTWFSQSTNLFKINHQCSYQKLFEKRGFQETIENSAIHRINTSFVGQKVQLFVRYFRLDRIFFFIWKKQWFWRVQTNVFDSSWNQLINYTWLKKR